MTDKDYNGWSNRETWALHLHLTGVQDVEMFLHLLIAEARSEPRATEFLTNVQGERIWLEDALREGAEIAFERALNPEFEHGRMVESLSVGDSIGMSNPADVYRMIADVGSLWRVNWREIAEHLLAE